jgi:hypothetical protein
MLTEKEFEKLYARVVESKEPVKAKQAAKPVKPTLSPAAAAVQKAADLNTRQGEQAKARLDKAMTDWSHKILSAEAQKATAEARDAKMLSIIQDKTAEAQAKAAETDATLYVEDSTIGLTAYNVAMVALQMGPIENLDNNIAPAIDLLRKVGKALRLRQVINQK